VSVYKPCDIRGPAEEMSADLYRAWGRSLGGRLPAGAAFVIGGDVRVSTPRFLSGLEAGLAESGAAVENLGVAPTPMIYFERRRADAAGCAIVTASHSPARMNGLKWMLGAQPPTEADVQALRREAEAGARLARPGGSARSVRGDDAYAAWLAAAFGAAAPVRVVADPGGGCWAGRALRFLSAAFTAGRFTAIHDRPDGTFAERDPDCACAEALDKLSGEVLARGADLGVAFDGDGDRVAFVDGEGRPLSAEEATFVLIRGFGGRWPGRAFVRDIKFSRRMDEAAEALGGRAVVERSGHAFIRTRMLAEKALFGAEISGHYFFEALGGGDDGLYAACRMIERVAASGRRLSELRAECPRVFMTRDLRLAPEGESRSEALARIRAAFSDRPMSFVDGVKVELDGGWALVRSSVTEASLTFRFEGDSAAGLDGVVARFCGRLGAMGEKLAAQLAEGRKAKD